MDIRENLQEVEQRIADACKQAGRAREAVTLIAVSKTHPAEAVREALACGQTVFGENRVQELREKSAAVDGVQWHLIGTLQTNKVKYLPEIGGLSMIHSVDSLKLAREIDKRYEQAGACMDVLLEVNMAQEETKQGIAPDEAETLLREIVQLSHLSVRGLMTIAPFTEDAESNRRYFSGLRDLMERLNRITIVSEPMTMLSMGMSGDYCVAIEEGATLVRVGTAVFGARDYNHF